MSRSIDFSVGEYYHLYNRGTDQRQVFSKQSDYLRFILLLYICNSSEVIHLSNYRGKKFEDFFQLEKSKPILHIGAYCLMPNHFHLLVKEYKEGGISIFMQKLTTAYTMYFNKRNTRTGALFQGTFKARYADSDEYLKYLFSYIHLNPVKLIDKDWKKTGVTDKKGAEDFLKNYKYSSYLDYLSEDRPQSNIISKSDFPNYFQSPNVFMEEIYYWLNYDQPEGLARWQG